MSDYDQIISCLARMREPMVKAHPERLSGAASDALECALLLEEWQKEQAERVDELTEQASYLCDAADDWLHDTKDSDHHLEWQGLSDATQGMKMLLGSTSRQITNTDASTSDADGGSTGQCSDENRPKPVGSGSSCNPHASPTAQLVEHGE